MGFSSVAPPGHQSQVLQQHSLCEQHVPYCGGWTVIVVGMLVSRVGSVTIVVHMPVFRADPPESEPLLGVLVPAGIVRRVGCGRF